MAKEDGPLTAFSIYLRSGRQPQCAVDLERKFNPWHDPEDGRFTFAGRGRYFAQGSSAGSSSSPSGTGAQEPISRMAAKPSLSGRGSVASDARQDDGAGTGRPFRYDPRHPANYSIHAVSRGQTLTRIAAMRRGLRVSDLAWLNDIPVDATLHVGQKLKLPTQAYLEAGRAARARFMALSHYMDTHGGKLPPDLTNVPSIQQQIDTALTVEVRNGYAFKIDQIFRTRDINGYLSDGSQSGRSRRVQATAGGADRRTTDDGGHYIAARFNGPREWFNHFAQDANFNRGRYRAIEESWAKELRAGHKVFVDIVPHYPGLSRRPDSLTITWLIDGKRLQRTLANEKGGKSGKR